MKRMLFTGVFTIAILLSLNLNAQPDLPSWNKLPSSETIVDYIGFTVSYNHETKCPNWVAWDLTPEEAAADAVGRTDYFQPDPGLVGPQAAYRDYSRNNYGLDRGHMAPSADFKWSRDANEQTFYLTNICPQDHTLNEGLWLELEQRCRAWAKRYDTTVNIICGPLFGTGQKTIGQNAVSVPAAFFKFVRMQFDRKAYAIAFVLPNEPVDARRDLFDFCVSVSDAERLAHIIPFLDDYYEEPGKGYPFDIPWKKANE